MIALIADAGNSKLRLVRWDTQATEAGGDIRLDALDVWPTPRDPRAQGQLAGWVAAHVVQTKAAALVLVSVVPGVTEALQAMLDRVVVLDHGIALPFKQEVADPASVGADRYCNVAAATAAGWTDALIIDAGSATTFDLLQGGVFRGGLIAPGMAFAAQKLGEEAAQLAPVAFEACELAVGGDTASAMRAGAYHVARLGVLATAQALLDRYGERPVVMTGGLGRFLSGPDWPYVEDWTLRGAAHLAGPILNDGI